MLRRTGPFMNASPSTLLRQLRCDGQFWSLRLVDERAEYYAVRKNVPQPPALLADHGAMLTAYAEGGCGYAATSALSVTGLQAALDRATAWARASARRSLIDFRTLPRPAPRGAYTSPDVGVHGRSQREWYDLLSDESRQARCNPRIVDWDA